MNLKGTSIIGFLRGEETAKLFTAFSPKTGEAVTPEFHGASITELEAACNLAAACRIEYGKKSGFEKAVFLRRIAENIEALGSELVERASLETGLPNARFEGERDRTTLQLRMFADLVEKGEWVDARIDTPNAERTPVAKPDVRSMLRPIGAVAVFCASNFPLAYSVAGGDSASALAAGCPIIVNAHYAHPGTAELVGVAIMNAAKECGMPEGVFSLLFSTGYEIGQALVKNPNIKAVGFTGSRAGGRALMDIAAARVEPIPVYAEMSAVNPIFILPSAIKNRKDEIASGLHASVTTGAGQFCTKPGLVFVPDSVETGEFIDKFSVKLSETAPHPLLTEGIRDNFKKLVSERELQIEEVERNGNDYNVNATFATVTIEEFINNPKLSQEVFGPATLLIKAENSAQLVEAARNLEGQLTASVLGTPEDLLENTKLLEILETKVGRLIFNGYPTGVEVGAAMVHGGPYPATSDSRTSAVGTRAIRRFCRFVCYQNFPESALPPELKLKNPLGINQIIDGK
ncbi:MAG: aldehyde dehydrogenase (NADP(+)) [Pyrinomonadaceae bacterium]